MTTYRTGNHWGVTIVREATGSIAHGEGAQLVAVVVNADQALAERICALLNFEQAQPRPNDCGCPATYERARVSRHTSACGLRKTAERLSAYLDAEDGDGDAPSRPLSAPVSASSTSGVPVSTPDVAKAAEGKCEDCEQWCCLRHGTVI